MNPSAHIATQFRQVLFGGNWTWTTMKETLSDTSYEEATHQVGELNSILSLAHHIAYYFHVQLKVLQGGPLEGSDKESWETPAISSQAEWDAKVKHILDTGEQLSKAIESIAEEQWEADFSAEKYGSYYRNFHGMIEHTHYHLGQIVLLKKILRESITLT